MLFVIFVVIGVFIGVFVVDDEGVGFGFFLGLVVGYVISFWLCIIVFECDI